MRLDCCLREGEDLLYRARGAVGQRSPLVSLKAALPRDGAGMHGQRLGEIYDVMIGCLTECRMSGQPQPNG